MPRNKYPEETVKIILEAALKLFLEKGYEQTTILDIVSEMGGLTRGAFYHHFKSKEEVLEAVMNMLFYEVNPFERVKQEKGLSGLGKIKLALKYSVVDGFMDERKASMDRIALPLMSNPQFLAGQLKSTQEVSYLLEELIAEGMGDGSIQRGNSKILAEVTMLLFNIWMIPTIYPCDDNEAWEKILLIKQMLDSVGISIIDKDILDGFKNVNFEYS